MHSLFSKAMSLFRQGKLEEASRILYGNVAVILVKSDGTERKYKDGKLASVKYSDGTEIKYDENGNPVSS